MNSQKIVFRFLILALVAVLVATVSWPAHALRTQPQPQAQPLADVKFGQPSPLVIPAAAFSSDGFDANSFFFSFAGGYLVGKDVLDGCVKAPVYLPKWARVYEVWASVYDNDSTYNIAVDVRRVDNFTGVATSMANMVSSGAYTYIQTPYDITITNPLVIYPDFSYYVTTCLLSSTLRLYSVRIYYTGPYGNYLPIIYRK